MHKQSYESSYCEQKEGRVGISFRVLEGRSLKTEMNPNFSIIGLTIFSLLVSESFGLLNNGKNVCSKVEHRADKYIAKVTKKVPVTKKVKCWDFSKGFQCDKVSYESRIVDEERTRIIPVRTYFCCRESRRVGDECVRPDLLNKWTFSATGCQCYFDPTKTNECGCCVSGGCQCSSTFPNKCVQCGYGYKCHPMFDRENLQGVDAWTTSETGCACDGSNNPGDCPCCQNRGCQCKVGNTKRCRQCGLPQTCNEDQDTEE